MRSVAGSGFPDDEIRSSCTMRQYQLNSVQRKAHSLNKGDYEHQNSEIVQSSILRLEQSPRSQQLRHDSCELPSSSFPSLAQLLK